MCSWCAHTHLGSEERRRQRRDADRSRRRRLGRDVIAVADDVLERSGLALGRDAGGLASGTVDGRVARQRRLCQPEEDTSCRWERIVTCAKEQACLSASGGGGGESLSTSLSPAAGTSSSLSLSSMLIEFLQRAGVCTPKRVDRCSSWRSYDWGWRLCRATPLLLVTGDCAEHSYYDCGY